MEVHFRKRHQDDDAFIYSTWLRGQRNEGANKHIGNSIYYANQADAIKPLIERSQAIVACNPTSHEQLYGFLVFDTLEDIHIAHYLHIKEPFRNLGIGKKMLKLAFKNFGKEETVITYINSFASYRAGKYNLVFNPFINQLIREIKGDPDASRRSIAAKITRIFGTD